MSFPFDARAGAVIVLGEISGPKGPAFLRLLLDTGASNSLVSEDILLNVGYDPAVTADRIKVAMGNGVEVVPRVMVTRFTALGVHRIGFRLLARNLPPEAGVDGLLGLDFLRGTLLTMDFRGGILSLT